MIEEQRASALIEVIRIDIELVDPVFF